MKTYKVENGSVWTKLVDARSEAEQLMASKHDDDSVAIYHQEKGENFFEPYARIVRENNRFVLKR